MSTRGRFITLEGLDGAGKSTHVTWISETLSRRGRRLAVTREPGGTALGEKLRALLLAEAMTHDTEALLMFAARSEHVQQVIRPALARGDWVVCDRFTDATYAYQGGGHGVSLQRIRELEDWVHGDCRPDLTLLFDLTPDAARERLARAVDSGRVLDKFEREAAAFFERVRLAYLQRATEEPQRFRVIDASRELVEVRKQIDAALAELPLANRSAKR